MRYSKTITIILCLFYISECIARIPTTPITLSEEYTFLELLADADRILNPQPVLVVSGERIDITTEENVRAASDVICCGEAAKAKGNTEADKNEEASKNIEDTESSSEHVVEQPTQDVDTENAALEERIKKMAEAEKIKRDKEARAAITARAIDAPQHMNIVAMARRGIARTQNSQMRAQDTISINIATEDVSNKRSDRESKILLKTMLIQKICSKS